MWTGPYLYIALVTTRPDGSLQEYGAISPSQNLHESCQNRDENGFSLWSEQWHFAKHIRPWEPPMVSFGLWMVEQQVTTVHMEKAAARELIIKEALRLCFCIVPSRDGHKRVDYPFQRRLCKIIICCQLIQRPSHKSLLSNKLHHCSQAMAASSENSAVHCDSWW